MGQSRMDPALIREAVALVERHGSVTAAANATGIARSTLSHRYNHREMLDPGHTPLSLTPRAAGECIDLAEDRTAGKLSLFVLSKDPRVQTIEAALEKANVDPEEWAVDRVRLNSYEMGCKVERADEKGRKTTLGVAVTPLFAVSATLIKRGPMDPQRLAKLLAARLAKQAPTYAKIVRPAAVRDSELMLELSMPDPHFGKLGWKPEVGEDYDCKIARKRYLDAADDLLSSAAREGPIQKIVYVLGNDHYHIDNMEGVTPASKHRLDMDSRWQKVWLEGKVAAMAVIDRARTIAPVEVKVVPGNHDPTWAYFLGECISAQYSHCGDVTIDNSPSNRKYIQWGVNLIGLCHGHAEKSRDLPLIMAREMKKQWADALFYEIHHGHWHKRKETEYVSGDTFNGVRVRVLPSLCGADAWHDQKGYMGGIPSADAYLWDASRGLRRVLIHQLVPET